jgi:hypothetical protein
VYVVAGSDAETHVRKRFPHKPVRQIRATLRPASPSGFFRGIPLTFQRGPAGSLKARLHFDLSGAEPLQATVVIDQGRIEVLDGLVGDPDLEVRTDGQLWLDIVTGRRNPIWAVVTRRLQLRGNRALLGRFARCFPR